VARQIAARGPPVRWRGPAGAVVPGALDALAGLRCGPDRLDALPVTRVTLPGLARRAPPDGRHALDGVSDHRHQVACRWSRSEAATVCWSTRGEVSGEPDAAGSAEVRAD